MTASELLYSSAVSRLRRPFLSDFFITVRLLKERAQLVDADFHLRALAFNRTRVRRPFDLTAWVFLPDHGHALGAPNREAQALLAETRPTPVIIGAYSQNLALA